LTYRYHLPMTAKEKLRERVEDLTEQEAEATLEFIAARGQSFGDWLESRPEDDEPLSPEEHAALDASDADIATGRGLLRADQRNRAVHGI
jgi:hypothetical protein